MPSNSVGSRIKNTLLGMSILLAIIFTVFSLFLGDFASPAEQPPQDAAEPIDHSMQYSFKKKILSHRTFVDSLEKIERNMNLFNSLNIRNLGKHAKLHTKIAILLIVRDRATYLKTAIELYSKVEGIENVLFIISHDGLYDDVIEVIETIDFAPVKELIFPYNHQFLSVIDENPGTRLSPQYKMGFERKSFGSVKLHFVWAMTQAWERVRTMDGMIKPLFNELCFMEDDYWVTPDFVVSLQKLMKARHDTCRSFCFGSILGNQKLLVPSRKRSDNDQDSESDRVVDDQENQENDENLDVPEAIVEEDPNNAINKTESKPIKEVIYYEFRLKCPGEWGIAGLSFPYSSWKLLHDNMEWFCKAQSRKWDKSLFMMMGKGCCRQPKEIKQTRLLEPLFLEAKFPRVYHVGVCGSVVGKSETEELDPEKCLVDGPLNTFNRKISTLSMPPSSTWEFETKPRKLLERKIYKCRELTDQKSYEEKLKGKTSEQLKDTCQLLANPKLYQEGLKL